MKNTTICGLLILALASACNKNNNNNNPTPTSDTTPPVIALSGKTNDTISLNSTYSDPGATAQDNTDGNISSNIVVTGTINKDQVGQYQKYYNVKDAAGNAAAQMTRYVYVKNDADYLAGTYSAVPNCGATQTGNSTTTLVTSSTINNQVSFGFPGNFTGITPSVIISGNNMSVPKQSTSNGDYIIGNGTIANDKKSFSMTYTASAGISFGYYSCTTAYTKQ